MSDNERRYRQEPFARFLREISSGSATNGLHDAPLIIPTEVPTQAVLDRFLAMHPTRAGDRQLFVELFHGRQEMSVSRDAWRQLGAV